MEENKEITIKEDYSFEKFAQEVELMTKVCKQLMATKHYQALGEAGIFAVLQRAKAMKIDPFDALNGGMYYISGKVGMSAELMASLIRKSGHSIVKDPTSNENACILHGKRADTGDEWTSTFTMIDADRAGLKKNMFLKYPAVMLYNRAMSMLARQLFPDVIKGCGYEKDELEEIEVINKPVKNWQSEEGQRITISGQMPGHIQISDSVPEYPPVVCVGIANTSTLHVEKVPEIQHIEPKVITGEMEEELKQLLLKDQDYKSKVDDFLGAKNLTSPDQLSYNDFEKILKRAKERVALKEVKNDPAKSA